MLQVSAIVDNIHKGSIHGCSLSLNSDGGCFLHQNSHTSLHNARVTHTVPPPGCLEWMLDLCHTDHLHIHLPNPFIKPSPSPTLSQPSCIGKQNPQHDSASPPTSAGVCSQSLVCLCLFPFFSPCTHHATTPQHTFTLTTHPPYNTVHWCTPSHANRAVCWCC